MKPKKSQKTIVGLDSIIMASTDVMNEETLSSKNENAVIYRRAPHYC